VTLEEKREKAQEVAPHLLLTLKKRELRSGAVQGTGTEEQRTESK